jgi:hypothetical protein
MEANVGKTKLETKGASFHMALSKKQQLALYLLMGTHGSGPDGMSALRTTVVNNTPAGGDYQPAFVAAAHNLDPSIVAADIGPLPDLMGATLRSALGFLTPYPANGTACPAGTDQQDAYTALTS